MGRLLLFGFLAITAAAFAQPIPECTLNWLFTGNGASVTVDNRTRGCAFWSFSFFSTGFTAANIAVQGAPDSNGSPGAFTDFPAGSIWHGSDTSFPFSIVVAPQKQALLYAYFPWVRINVTATAGSGSLRSSLYGFRSVQPVIASVGGQLAENSAYSATFQRPVLIGGRDVSGSNLMKPIRTSNFGALLPGLLATALNDGDGNTVALNRGVDDSTGSPETARQVVRNTVFNGTSWDRQRGSATAGTTVGGFGSGAAGTLFGLTACDSSAVVSVAAAATTQIVALVASRSVRVCAFSVSSTAAGTARWVSGTGANCGTGTVNRTGAYTLATGVPLAAGSGTGELLRTAAGEALCLAATGGQVDGLVSFAQF